MVTKKSANTVIKLQNCFSKKYVEIFLHLRDTQPLAHPPPPTGGQHSPRDLKRRQEVKKQTGDVRQTEDMRQKVDMRHKKNRRHKTDMRQT